MSNSDSEIEGVFHWFSRIYLGGIPPMITDDSAFLAFVCVLTATDALAGYRFPNADNGKRFIDFVGDYFPEEYREYKNDLWSLRNSIVHAFTTGRFALTHHHSEAHLREDSANLVVLNAEDFYGALLYAAQRYFKEVRKSPDLQEVLRQRLESKRGGSLTVGPLDFNK